MASPRLLFLSPEFPDPEGNGGELRLFKILDELARAGADVSLVAPGHAAKVERGSVLRDVGVDLHPVVRPESRAREAIGAALADPRVAGRLVTRSWLAWQTEVYLQEIGAELTRALETRPDGVVIEHDWALGWARAVPRPLPVGIVFHNLTDSLLRGQATTEHGVASLRARGDAVRARRDVERAIGRVSRAFACSDGDAAEVERRWAVPCAVVPNGADVARLARVRSGRETAGQLLFTGTMSYPPNAQAARWMVEEVLPLVRERRPDARLAIVGGSPTAEVSRLGERDAVTVTGRVPDLVPYFEDAAVVVAPLRAGGGTKLKVLEAMAAGRPVVATSVAAEGIETTAAEELRVADSAPAFAEAVVRLLDDPAEAARAGGAARDLATRRYSWKASAERMAAAVDEWLPAAARRP